MVSVPHTSFALRFSDLHEIEEACREDDDDRAERTIDWITARINHRCAKWVQDMEKTADKDTTKTPWWDELRRCVEGDFVPSKTEGWNHPVAGTNILSGHLATADAPSSHTRRLNDDPKPITGYYGPTFAKQPIASMG